MDFLVPGKASVLIDGQWGSTGKGLAAAWIASRETPDLAVTNASANAGHTTIMEDGRKIVCYHLPTIGVMTGCPIYLNAGAIIDPKVLWAEMEELNIRPSQVSVHPQAAVITHDDFVAERSLASGATKIASTQKGVGEALVRKIRRTGHLAGSNPELAPLVKAVDVAGRLRQGGKVSIEVPQGLDLSINHGYHYPFVTSREVSVSQALSDADLHPSDLGHVLMTLRTFPIRVGNIVDEEGNVMGYSGPCYGDQEELTWDQLGVAPEITTVTKRVRRVFSWSEQQTLRAGRAVRPDFVFLNFVNYLKSAEDLEERVLDIEDYCGDAHLIFGLGPKVSDICTTEEEAYKRMGWL